MNIGIEYTAALLLIGALVATAARRLNVPYTVGLMLTGTVRSNQRNYNTLLGCVCNVSIVSNVSIVRF